MNKTEPERTPECAARYRYVFCVGMRRGGSTLQTQLVSSLLEPEHVHLATPDTIEELIGRVSGETDRPVVIKSHRFLTAAADLAASGDARIVYVYRDLRDVVASIVKKYNTPPFAFVHGGLKTLLDEYLQWTSVPGIYIARYEQMTGDIAGEVHRLAGFLGVSVSHDTAIKLEDRFCLKGQRESIEKSAPADAAGTGTNRFDKKTLLHADHIQSGGSGAYRDVLPPRIVAAMEWQLRSWMRQHDYAPEHSTVAQLSSHIMFCVKALGHRTRAMICRRERNALESLPDR